MRASPNKTSQLQIRVSPEQKTRMKRYARATGVDLSSWVIARLLPDEREDFLGLVDRLSTQKEPSYLLAELSDLLAKYRPAELANATALSPRCTLPPLLENIVAAMVEQAAARRGIAPPEWTSRVAPLTEPYFATSLKNLRLLLLTGAPVTFRRRNLFVDASVGDRV
jgi:hypothetical protein